jgi:hypothetical protein
VHIERILFPEQINYFAPKMSNSHLIDYFVITAADLTAIFIGWLVGKGWLERKAKQLSIKWQKSGTLYWLSSDLMWTWMYANQGNVRRMNHGLRKAVHHATMLDIGDPLLSRLESLQAANAGKENLGPAEKAVIIHELDDIISRIGKLAEANQGDDFKADS